MVHDFADDDRPDGRGRIGLPRCGRRQRSEVKGAQTRLVTTEGYARIGRSERRLFCVAGQDTVSAGMQIDGLTVSTQTERFVTAGIGLVVEMPVVR